jgi:hypothetical protein
MFVDLQVGDLTEPLTGRSWKSQQAMAQIFHRVDRYGSRGIRRGDRVFLFYGNKLEFFADPARSLASRRKRRPDR